MGFLTDEEIRRAAARVSRHRSGLRSDVARPGQHDASRGHDAYVTIARTSRKPDCAIPDCGLEW